jgi:hypothetical protein
MNKEKIGICIYCGRDDRKLTNEHAIPDAIGGKYVLEKACCWNCQREINPFEQRVLRKAWGIARARMNMRGRSKKKRAPARPFGFLHDDTPIPIPLMDGSVDLVMLFADGPSHIARGKRPVVENKVKILARRLQNPKRNEHLLSHHSANFRQDDFFRLVAKISHGLGVFKYGYGNFRPLLNEYILSGNGNFHEFIGCDQTSISAKNTLHTWDFRNANYLKNHDI